MIATARTIQTSGIGTGDPGTFVYLNWTTGSQSPTIILALLDGSDEPGGMSVGMNWLTPTHLDLTYKGHKDLDFQAVKCHGIDISVRDLGSEKAQTGAVDSKQRDAELANPATDCLPENSSGASQPLSGVCTACVLGRVQRRSEPGEAEARSLVLGERWRAGMRFLFS